MAAALFWFGDAWWSKIQPHLPTEPCRHKRYDEQQNFSRRYAGVSIKTPLLACGIAFGGMFHVLTAFAAELPVKAPPKAAPTAFNWTGCYVGAHFGGSWGNKQLADSSGILTAVGVPSLSEDTGGFLPGGQIGCDYQMQGNWVIGAQAAASVFTMNGERLFPAGDSTIDFTARADWLASATGRIGYARHPWLFYARGGVAWVRERYDINGSGLAAPFDFAASGDTRTGWVLGIGLEYTLGDNWSADLQYNHYDFGTKTLTFIDSFSGVTAVAASRQWIDAVTLGLNYHLTGGSWQPAKPKASEDSDQKTVAVSGGITLTRPYSLYGNFAVMWAPDGLDNSGFRARLGTVDGQYSFLQNGNFGPRLYGTSQEGNAMVGYQFMQGTTSILLAAGVNYITGSSQNSTAATGNSFNPVSAGGVGAKVLAELNSNPTDRTMVYAEGSYSTALGGYYNQFQVGYAPFGHDIYIGPKVVLEGDQSYDEYQLGAFVSGFKVGKIELGFSGGYLRDRTQGGGYFVGADFDARY